MQNSSRIPHTANEIRSPIVLQMKDGRRYHCVGSVDLETVILKRESRVTNGRWKKLPLCETGGGVGSRSSQSEPVTLTLNQLFNLRSILDPTLTCATC